MLSFIFGVIVGTFLGVTITALINAAANTSFHFGLKKRID